MHFINKSILFVLAVIFIHSNLVFAQCSIKLPTEAVVNGNFEKGWLTANGTKYADGTPIGFMSDLGYAGDYNGSVNTCWNSIGDKFGIGKSDIAHGCDSEKPNNPYGGGSYLNSYQTKKVFIDHTPGLNGQGFGMVLDFYTCTGANSVSKIYNGGLPVAWAQKINVKPNENYFFSAWFAQYTYADRKSVV